MSFNKSRGSTSTPTFIFRLNGQKGGCQKVTSFFLLQKFTV